jgi:hypothetical protein
MKNSLVTLEPRSAKARNRLANSLNGNPVVVLEQVEDNRVFVASEDRNFCTWILTHNDPHWQVNF